MKYIKENIWWIVMIVFVIAFFGMVIAGAMKISDEQNEVREKCLRTDLVVLAGGRINTPRWVYDCTGVELKALKR